MRGRSDGTGLQERWLKEVLSKRKLVQESAMAAIVQAVMQSPRVNSILIGLVLGVVVTAMLLTAVVVWVMK